MAAIYDTFSASNSDWDVYGNRTWFVQSGHMRVQDAVAYRSGFIIHKTLPTLNGTLTADFTRMDLYNGPDNSIVVRYQDDNTFHGIRFNPGYSDRRGLYFTRANTDQWQSESNAVPPDVKIPLYRADGVALDDEIYPYKTNLPRTGRMIIKITNGSDYLFEWYNNAGTFFASGTHTDTIYSTSAGRSPI